MVESLDKQPKLLDQVQESVRLKHYSYKTEKSYVQWMIFNITRMEHYRFDILKNGV